MFSSLAGYAQSYTTCGWRAGGNSANRPISIPARLDDPAPLRNRTDQFIQPHCCRSGPPEKSRKAMATAQTGSMRHIRDPRRAIASLLFTSDHTHTRHQLSPSIDEQPATGHE
jgi:hypothetical protein